MEGGYQDGEDATLGRFVNRNNRVARAFGSYLGVDMGRVFTAGILGVEENRRRFEDF